MISNLTYALTQVVNITSSRINEVAAIAGTNEIEISNTSANSVPISITDVLGDNTILEWLQAIHQAVDTLELNVDNIENISLNTGDLEALQGSDAGAGNGDLSGYTYDSTNNLLTDIRTAIQLLDDAVVAAAATISGTTRYNLMAGTDGTNAVPLKTDASGNVQSDIVAELPEGTKNIGHVDIDTLIPTANLGQQASGASLSTTPATDVADGTYIGDIKFGEELPTGANAIGKLAANDGVDIGDVDVTSLPSAQIGETNQANSMSVTLATDDELLKTVDQSNNLVKVSSPTANNFNVTEANSTSIKTAVENLDNTVNGNNQLDVNIADGGFDGVVTNTVLTSLDDAINASRVDVNIAAGGFDGAVTNAANTQLAVTTVQSTFDTGQNSQVGSTARVQVKSASQALQSGITVVASSANTASVFLGDSQVENSGGNIGFELAAGAGFTFSLSNANLLYAISASGTQTVNFVAM